MPDFTAAGWTLADIIAKFRAVTSRPDTSQISDQQCVDYINRYYQYVLPKELKTFYGYTYYDFFTFSGEDQYTPPDTIYQNYVPQLFIDGYPSQWYLDPALFYQDYPIQERQQIVATADGATFGFVFAFDATPILKRSFYVTDGTQILQDNGSGNMVGNGFGSVNYATGAVSIAFTAEPAANANITATGQPYIASRPQGLLYYNNKFIIRPVPDNVYPVRIQAINIPTALLDRVSVPYRTDMGPLIAYGAAIELFSDFNQTDQIAQIAEQYKRYKDVSMQDTYEEYMSQRALPRF